ncbi:MAG: hypothetical protein AB1547_12005 [Thermodesulfobacteriota bacterium]
MSESFHVPDDMIGAFNRLMNRIPPELREDETIRGKALSFLKLGGEPLARQWAETMKKSFPDAATLFKRPVREPQTDDAESADAAETAEEEVVAEEDEAFASEIDDDIVDPAEFD